MTYKKTLPIAAPRLRAYLRRKEGAIVMLREDWNKLISQGGNTYEIDISETPFFEMVLDTKVVGCFAERINKGKTHIVIFRYDDKDEPDERINKYSFFLNEDFRNRVDYHELIKQSSTADDTHMRIFLEEYVIIIPEEKAKDHHLPEIPRKYVAILSKARKKPKPPEFLFNVKTK